MAIRIAKSAVGGQIYAGRINKAGDAFTGEKTDVTSDVLKAVVEYVGPDKELIVFVAGQPKYAIRVTEIKD